MCQLTGASSALENGTSLEPAFRFGVRIDRSRTLIRALTHITEMTSLFTDVFKDLLFVINSETESQDRANPGLTLSPLCVT